MSDSYDEMDYENDPPVQNSRSQSRSPSASTRSYSRSRSRSPRRSNKSSRKYDKKSSSSSKHKRHSSSRRSRRSRSRSEEQERSKSHRKSKTKSSGRVKKEASSSRRRRSPSSSEESSGRRTPSSSRSSTRSPSPKRKGVRSRSRDRHGNKIVKLKDRKDRKPVSNAGPRSPSTRSPSPVNTNERVNIYERPHGPRTGIGYVKSGILEMRFVVPSKIAGSVIGKGGDLVQQLRKKHDCEIGVPVSDDSIDRIVIVRGRSVRNVIDCVCSIADYPLKKEMGRGLNLQPDCSQIRLLMHQSICGNVIGKGGEIIHEIRTEAGTDVHMYNEVCPRSTDRICRITGRISEIRDALAMVFKFTGETNCKGKENDYDAKNSTGNEDGRDYGGWRLSEVRHMGAPEHADEYAHNKKKLPKYDRHGNLRSANLTEKMREQKSTRSYSDSDDDSDRTDSDSDYNNDPQKRIQREIKREFESRGKMKKGKTHYSPKVMKGHVRSNNIREKRGGSRDRHGNKKVRSFRDRDADDAPVYEGPNSSGPNRSDRKREHPLTALDLKRMQDKEGKKRKKGLLDSE